MTTRLIFLALLSSAVLHAQPPAYDLVIRHGTIVDGSGLRRYDGDVAIKNGFIVAIGKVTGSATTEINARGMFVAPGFINIHSHASPDALPTAVNMLLQGVTTEIINADGGGPLDVAAQMRSLEVPGLAVNIGGYIGFNAVWQNVVGNTDRRPSAEDIQKMRGLIAAGLDQGAWGVSAGLDYKPGYFAQTEEVIKVVDVAKPYRTNFTNHDRITPESNFSSRVGIAETLAIGEKAGMVPVVTHMKVQGREQGTASAVLAAMAQTTKRGQYTAADAYPYLAGQSGLGSLIIPGWAQEGGREAMLKRFADPETRARIVKESEEAMAARFGGPQGVYLPRTQQELTAVMKEMNAGAGETIVRILEKSGDPGAILRFGAEEDLVKILKDPVVAMACDCGASTATRVHPRFYGSFPRVLGRYVREQQIMSFEEAIRKSSWLPASTIGMTDRGLIALGMAADVVVFDPNTIIDRSTYETPAVPSEGITHVIVNGMVEVSGGVANGAKGGRALMRASKMVSRPANADLRRLEVKSMTNDRAHAVAISVSQGAGVRAAAGQLTIGGVTYEPGFLQTTSRWASISGVADGHVISVIADQATPTSVAVTIDGKQTFTLMPREVSIR